MIFFTGMFLGFVLVFIILSLNPICNRYYKNGQIDALTGNVEFNLVTKPDSTREWERIKE